MPIAGALARNSCWRALLLLCVAHGTLCLQGCCASCSCCLPNVAASLC